MQTKIRSYASIIFAGLLVIALIGCTKTATSVTSDSPVLEKIGAADIDIVTLAQLQHQKMTLKQDEPSSEKIQGSSAGSKFKTQTFRAKAVLIPDSYVDVTRNINGEIYSGGIYTFTTNNETETLLYLNYYPNPNDMTHFKNYQECTNNLYSTKFDSNTYLICTYNAETQMLIMHMEMTASGTVSYVKNGVNWATFNLHDMAVKSDVAFSGDARTGTASITYPFVLDIYSPLDNTKLSYEGVFSHSGSVSDDDAVPLDSTLTRTNGNEKIVVGKISIDLFTCELTVSVYDENGVLTVVTSN